MNTLSDKDKTEEETKMQSNPNTKTSSYVSILYCIY